MGGGALAKRRRAEAQEAGRRLGVVYDVMDNHDGELMPTLENRLAVIRKIREWNADVVLAPRPNDYHPDHRYTGVLLQDTAYMVVVPNVTPDTPPLKKNPVYLYFSDRFQKPEPFRPDISVIIDAAAAQKVDALDAHVSQMYEWLPWVDGQLAEVPADPAKRKAWLAQTRGGRIAPDVRKNLEKWYGAAKAGAAQHVESFEIAEYGKQPNDAEIRRLFPVIQSRVEFASLPSVDELLRECGSGYPHALAVAEIRAVLDEARKAIRAGSSTPGDLAPKVRERLTRWTQPTLRPVINGTGVVLHTNLGRAPLELDPISGYLNLEYDLATGKRGKRDSHFVPLLEKLLSAPAIAVNNNAAATYLVLNEFAAGGEVIVSRGELIEIGDGFRIPEIMERSGAILREVGTTNKTNLDDYRRAISERTRMILRVHPSNFHISGFTAKPTLRELASLGVPVYEDLGSGCLVDLREAGVTEPLVGESLQAGIDLVSFSCDKLLGGPQTGIIAGKKDLVERVRRNPMYRAFRPDKLIVQALAATLRNLLLERYDAIPALRMIRMPLSEIGARAEALAARIPGARVMEGESVIGGGSTPDQSLPTWLVAIACDSPNARERRLRQGDPPVIVRIERDQLLIDLRTVLPAEEPALAAALLEALDLPAPAGLD
jgi:L-seryl-tRNA(Ser) seleniumtransferase